MTQSEDDIWVPVVTNAPKDYDWGWTRPICDNYATADLKDKTMRLVEVHTQYHAKLQMDRYGSGLYGAMPKAQFDADALKYPDLYQLTHTRVEYRRHDFDFTLVPKWDEGVNEFLDAIEAAKKMDDVVSLETTSGGLNYELVVNATPERLAVVVKFIDDAYNAGAAKNKES